MDARFLEWKDTVQDRQRKASFGLGELFVQAADILKKEGRFGDCNTVRDLVERYCKVSWAEIHRLMFASDIRELIVSAHLPEPVNERQVRGLLHLGKLVLPPDVLSRLFRDAPECYVLARGEREANLMLLAWKRACVHSQTGNPRYLDVDREVQKLWRLAKNPDEPIQKEFVRYRQHEKRIQLAARHATQYLATDALEIFLNSDRKKDRDKVKRLIADKIKCIIEQETQLEKLGGEPVDWSSVGHRSLTDLLPKQGQPLLAGVLHRLVKQFGLNVVYEEMALVRMREKLLAILEKATLAQERNTP